MRKGNKKFLKRGKNEEKKFTKTERKMKKKRGMKRLFFWLLYQIFTET